MMKRGGRVDGLGGSRLDTVRLLNGDALRWVRMVT
jgi:hypothetical protein